MNSVPVTQGYQVKLDIKCIKSVRRLSKTEKGRNDWKREHGTGKPDYKTGITGSVSRKAAVPTLSSTRIENTIGRFYSRISSLMGDGLTIGMIHSRPTKVTLWYQQAERCHVSIQLGELAVKQKETHKRWQPSNLLPQCHADVRECAARCLTHLRSKLTLGQRSLSARTCKQRKTIQSCLLMTNRH